MNEDRKEQQEQVTALTANAKGVSAMLGISIRQVWRLHTTGRLPKAIRLGNCVRWRRVEIEAFVEAGCPNRETFEANQLRMRKTI